MHLHHDAVVAQLAGAHAKDAGVDQDAQPLHVGAEGPGLGLGPRAARVHRRQAHQRRRHQLHTQQALISKEVTSEVTLGSVPPASTAGRHTSADATSCARLLRMCLSGRAPAVAASASHTPGRLPLTLGLCCFATFSVAASLTVVSRGRSSKLLPPLANTAVHAGRTWLHQNPCGLSCETRFEASEARAP